LKHGADPNLKDSFYNATPFLWAASEGNLEIVRLMIENGADLSLPSTIGWASSSGNPDLIRLLIEKGVPGASGVLMRSISREDTTMALAVLETAKFEENELSDALAEAKSKQLKTIIEKLVEMGAQEVEAADAASEFEQFTGDFESDVVAAKLEIKNAKLTISFGGGAAIALKQKEEAIFTAPDVEGSLVTFTVANGLASGFTFERPGRGSQTQTLIFARARKTPTELASVSELLKIDANRTVQNPQHWASFRGNTASGVADGQFPPTVWNADENLNLAWKTEISGLAHASPVVWGDRIFVATAISGDPTAEYRVGLYGDVDYVNDSSVHMWKLYCLNRVDGRVLWEKVAYKGVPRVKRHPKATQANSTPATNGKYVVALFGSEGLLCYDMDGELQWQKDLGLLDGSWFYDEEIQWGHASSPIIYKNLVIVQCDRSKDSYLAAFELASGKELWRTKRAENPSWGTPTAISSNGRDELVINSSRYVYGYNPSSGEELWRHKMNSEVVVATPVFDNDMIYVTSGYPPSRPVMAIRPGGSGDISLPDSLNSSEQVAWRHKQGGTYMLTPIAYQGYFYTCSNNGVLTCYDAITGERKYRARVAGRGGYAFTASPVAADGKLYFASEEGDVFVLKAGPEYELIAKNPVNEILMATPAISNGMIYIRGQHHLFAFGSQLAAAK
ncbi:PQQ-binding-like beta-propeller repeat protein, partial [bacterium]|nr:PQQ-binding-like beta-propeller repeat protein [bacterium]